MPLKSREPNLGAALCFYAARKITFLLALIVRWAVCTVRLQISLIIIRQNCIDRVIKLSAFPTQHAAREAQVITIRFGNEVECVDVPDLEIHTMNIVTSRTKNDSANF